MRMLGRIALVLSATAAMGTVAHAGGFSRGSANLDGLYASEDGDEPITAYMGVTFVSPGRSFDSLSVDINGTLIDQGETEFSEDFVVPFASIGLKLSDNVRCVGSYSQPYGAASQYEGAAQFQVAAQSIDTFELGATCSFGYEVGPGIAYGIGGVFYERLEYNQSRDFRVLPGNPLGAVAQSRISVDSEEVGFRLGAAYEIPDIALRASLTYRSETNHDVEGTFSDTPFQGIFGGRALALGDAANELATAAANAQAAGNAQLAAQLAAQANAIGSQAMQQGALALGAGATQQAGAFGSATLPQQIELSLRSGINPSTLLFGSVKWTEWSSIQQIDLNDTISNAAFTNFQGFFEDGFTVTVGVGRKITEELSGSLAFTWDEGVGTGFDTFSDTYTVSAGAAYQLNEIANIRGGGALIYFTEGEQTEGNFRGVAGEEFGFALSSSLNIKF